jgi:hypothetical protein
MAALRHKNDSMLRQAQQTPPGGSTVGMAAGGSTVGMEGTSPEVKPMRAHRKKLVQPDGLLTITFETKETLGRGYSFV